MQSEKEIADKIVGMERAALNRWGRGDPDGFLEISDPDVVYFDPFQAKRIDGKGELARLYDSLRGQIHVDRYELLNPKVQVAGDAAVLTFNYVSFDGEAQSRWNCTEVYARRGEDWRIVQTHWSFTQAGK